MAYLNAQADGNIGDAAPWGTLVVGNDNAAPVAGTALSTTYVAASTTNTPGAITIDALLVKLATVVAGTGGTVSFALNTGGGSSIVTGSDVTVNIADLPVCSTGAANDEGGWFVAKLAAPLLLSAATAYSLTAKVTGATGGAAVTLLATATTNWTWLMRQSGTTNTPGAADLLIIGREWTAAGTGTARVITMNSTSATAVLVGAGSCGAINICKGGTLKNATTASTAWKLTVGNGTTASDVRVYSGGSWLFNTLDATSTCDFVLNVTAAQADGLSGFIVKNGGTATGVGATVATVSTKLTANAAGAATTLTVAATAGWVATDTIAIASTTRTPGDTESATISTVASGASVTVPAIANAHLGTSPTQAEVVHLTRSLKIRSNQTALGSTGSAYIDIKPGAIVSFDYVELSYLGANATSQHGIEIETTTGTCSITHSSLHDFRNWGVVISTATGSVTFSNNVGYNLNTVVASSTCGVQISATTGIHVLDSNVFLGIKTPNNGNCVLLLDVGSTYTNNTVAGSGTGTNGAAVQYQESGLIGTSTGWTIHSCPGVGIILSNTGMVGTIGSAGGPCNVWRNGAEGVRYFSADWMILDSWTMFGNTTENVNYNGNGWLWLKSATSRSDATFSTASGVAVQTVSPLYITDSDFGATTAHTQDITVPASQGGLVYAWNTNFRSASGAPTIAATSAPLTIVRSHKNAGGAVTAFKAWHRFGALSADNTHLDTGQTTGVKCAPNANASASRPFFYPGPTQWDTDRVDVLANPSPSLSLSVNVYLSASGGTGVTLHAVGGPVAGVGSWGTDVTAATTTTGSFQTLTVSGLVPTEQGELEFYLSADSSTTVFWVGDYTISAAPTVDTTTMQVIARGLPAQTMYKVTAGGGLLRPAGMNGGFNN